MTWSRSPKQIVEVDPPIQVLTATWSKAGQLDWWEEVEGQIAVIKDHAQRETETIRNVDPDASEVPYNGPEYRAYVKEQRALIREISEETGQLPTRIARLETDVKNPLTDYDVLAMDADGNLHAVVDSPAPVQQ